MADGMAGSASRPKDGNGDNYMDIHEYAVNGDVSGVRNELAKGVSVDARDEEDFTPLARAAESPTADVEILRLLIDSGADVNSANDRQKATPLGLAACLGSLAKVQFLVDSGADVNATSPTGYTALINVTYALHDDQRLVPMIELLLGKGAEMNCETSYGERPLTVAASQGRFDAAKCLLDAGADPAPLGWTDLMTAIALGTSEEVGNYLTNPNVLAHRDTFDRTPWLLAAVVGDLEKAKLLRAAGADVDERGRVGDTALMICATKQNAEMLRWLIEIGANVDAVDKSGYTALMHGALSGAADCVRLLLRAGADPSRKNEYGDSAVSLASSEETVRLLIAAGEDIGDISTEMKRKLTGLQGDQRLKVGDAEYRTGSRPRFGSSNPEVMDIPFWHEMVRAGVSAYEAKLQFGDTENVNPVWCFDRYGTSFTALPDGRFVQIGGEHEDWYDPDFCIYNDVVVHEQPGKFEIMGYPRDVFPPTDFHSATHVDGYIYILGSLGYAGSRRVGTTPVYRLNCQTWEIESVQTTGDNPGWIYKHRARFAAPGVLVVRGGNIIREVEGEEQEVPNDKEFRLDLVSMSWSSL